MGLSNLFENYGKSKCHENSHFDSHWRETSIMSKLWFQMYHKVESFQTPKKQTQPINEICNDIFTAFFRSYLIFHFQISYRVHQFMLDTDNLGVLIVQRSWKPIKIWKDISGFILEKNLLAANIVNIHATEKVL